MDKLTSIRIKYSDGTYLDEVPIGVFAQNVGYDSDHNLIQILGNVDVESNGTIQQQINRLFNEKLNTSDLSSYVNSKITTDVSTWLANNVNPVGSAVIVDQSLNISGAAADAKVTGDAIATIKNDFNEKNALDDTAIFDKSEFISEAWYAGGISVRGKNTASDTRIRSSYIPIAAEQQMIITPQEGTKIKIGFFASANEDSFYKIDDTWTTGGIPRTIINNGEQFYIRILGGYENDDVISDVADVSEEIQIDIYIHKDFVRYDTFYKGTYDNIRISIKNTEHAYWNIETGVAVKTEISGSFYASNPISVNQGDVYTLTSRQGNTQKTRIWVITDNDYNIVAMCENYPDNDSHTVTFTVPEGGTLLMLTKQTPTASQTLYKKISVVDILKEKPLSGKKMSLLGDSISALAGTIPEGNAAYYSGSNHGITNASQMWWSVLCEETGMEPCIINGWSGSGINWQTDSAHMNIVPMSDDTRCGGLHDDTNVPDIILIAGGVNDYIYAQYAQNEPLAWDGKSAPSYIEPETGKQIYNSFTGAYVAMIKKLQTNYPNAVIVALSTWFTMRGNDNGFTLTHTVGDNVYTQQDYNDKIRYVAEQMHIPYIDVSNIGFNRNNFYPTYASDSATIPTHPTAAGHAVMGKAIAIKIIDAVKGFM